MPSTPSTPPVSNRPARPIEAGAQQPDLRARRLPDSKPVPLRTIVLALGLVLLVAGIGFAAVVVVLRANFAPVVTEPGRPVAVTIGTTDLTLAAGYFRVPQQLRGGLLARLDLALDATSLSPAGYRAADSADLEGYIFVSLEPAREGGDPANRAEELYSRFLTPEAEEVEGGLIKRSFRPRSPYDDEQLYIAAPDGRAFTARCGPVNARTMPPSCLWLVRHGGLDLQIRFAPRQLRDWQRIAAGVFDLMADMRRKDGGATTP